MTTHAFIKLTLGCACLLAIVQVCGNADAETDRRHNTRFSLKLDNVPLGQCLERLSRLSGTPLSASGALSDERLDACAPDSTLDEFMRATASLYRGRWKRRERMSGESYVLEKSDQSKHQEIELRQACIKRLGQQVAAASSLGAPRNDAASVRVMQHSLRQSLRFLSQDEWMGLSSNLSIAKSLNTLPADLKARLVEAHERMIEDAREAERLDEEERLQRGEAALPVVGPAPDASVRGSGSALLLDIKRYEGLHLFGTLSQGSVTGCTSLGRITPASMVEMGRRLYSAKLLRPTESANARSAVAVGDDPFRRPLSDQQSLREDRRWFEAMCLLAEATGISIYSDHYATTPRIEFKLSNETAATAETILDERCKQRGAKAFWWRQDRTALIRSEEWFWQDDEVLPAGLSEAIASNIQRSGRLTAVDLAKLERLTPSQVAGLLERPGEFAVWRIAVRAPVAAGGVAAEQACSTGFTSNSLLPTQIGRLAGIGWPFPLRSGSSFQARVTGTLSGRGRTEGVRLELTTVLNGVTQTTPVLLPASRTGEIIVKSLR